MPTRCAASSTSSASQNRSLATFNLPSPTGTYTASVDTVRLGVGLHFGVEIEDLAQFANQVYEALATLRSEYASTQEAAS